MADSFIDIDHHSTEFLDRRFAHYQRLREECPVAFNREHGGFWMVSSYEGVHAVARDNDTFAHKYEPDAPDGIDYQGILGYPRSPDQVKVGIAETDGPDHAELRHALNPFFSPQVVAQSLPLMEAVASWFIDEIIEAGAADLVLDYTVPVPAVLTLKMMGLPCDNWRRYAEFFHAMSEHPDNTPEFAEAAAQAPAMIGELLEFAEARRRAPTDDLTSFLAQLELNGRSLTDEEVGLTMFNLVAGGLDTTTSLTSWALYHLGNQTDARQTLLDDPSLVPAAVEEFLRYVSPSETLSRTATRDVELCGNQVKRGDRVLISTVSANRDSNVFPDADEIRFDRGENRHLAFGLGRHRCIGSHIARAQSQVILSEALRRVPDFVVDDKQFHPYPPNGLMTGVAQMPVTFTPGKRVGDGIPPF